MRDVKFRAWNKKLKTFAPDNCNIQIQGDDAHVSFDFFDGNFDTAVWYLDDVELMQFTGLKDKNGVEIYEGDILKGLVDCFGVSISGYFSSKSVGFGVNYSRGGDCSKFSIEANPFGQEKDLEVIGNIHENPELLA